MAIAELTLVPVGVGTHMSKYIAGAEKVLEEFDLDHELTPMGTNIEGDLSEIFEAIKKMQETIFDNGATRVYTVIKIDDNRDNPHKMRDKVKAVKDKM